MEKELTEELKSASYLHMQCDGWSNIRNEGIINFLISKPEPIFVKSLNTETHRHTSEYLSEEILKVMRTYGDTKFVTTIGDNAKNMQRAFQLVKDTYPHITALGCAAHTLNLLCQDCIRTESMQNFISKAVDTIKIVKRSQILSSLLSKIVKEKGSGEKLKLPCNTRWGSHVSALKSLKNTKVALQTLAVHEGVQISYETKTILLEEEFWKKIEESISILEPVTKKNFLLEGNKCNINEVFMAFKDIKSKLTFILPDVSLISGDEKIKILTAVEKRMTNCIKPIHLAAYLLDPKTQGVELEENQELEAMEFIYNMGRYLHLEVMPDLANYKAKEGLWGKSFVWSNIDKIDAITWWKGICGSKQLSKVAIRILSAPSTSAATERSFSVQSTIHSAKRNRLTTERAAKIAYINYNWNLLHKYEEHLEDEKTPTTTPAKDNQPTPTTSRGTASDFEFLDMNTINRLDSDISDSD